MGGPQRRIGRFLERKTGGRIYRWLAWGALASCLALVASDVSMWFVLSGYNPVAGTISDLAAGPTAWVVDGGLIVFALGILTLAGAFTLRDDPDPISWLVRISLVVMAAALIAMATIENYSGNRRGLELHPYFATLFGAAVAIVLWFAPERGADDAFINITRTFAVLWVIGAGSLSLMPEAYLGLLERALMMLLISSVVGAALRLLRVSDERPPR